MNIFYVLTAGDSSDWYDAPHKHVQRNTSLTSGGWQLHYQLRGPSQLTLTAAPEGDGWRTRITASQSAALEPGEYVVVAQLAKDDERLTIGRGKLTILRDPASITEAVDARSVAERALADCEAALASFKSSGGKIKSYTIGSRTTEFHSLTELMALRDMWQRKVNNERARKSGRRNPRAVLVRFQ